MLLGPIPCKSSHSEVAPQVSSRGSAHAGQMETGKPSPVFCFPAGAEQREVWLNCVLDAVFHHGLLQRSAAVMDRAASGSASRLCECEDYKNPTDMINNPAQPNHLHITSNSPKPDAK